MYHRLIVPAQHIHPDHHNCLEIMAARGRTADIETLARRLKTTKDVKYASLAAALTGRNPWLDTVFPAR